MEKKKRPKPNTARSAGRLAAVQGLYRIELSDARVDDVIRETMTPEAETEDGGPITESDRELMARILRGVITNQTEIDEMLGHALKGDMVKRCCVSCCGLVCRNWPLTRQRRHGWSLMNI